MVVPCWIPKAHKLCTQKLDVNCLPWSKVSLMGMPKPATQVFLRASVQALVSRVTGSSHLLERSMMVKGTVSPDIFAPFYFFSKFSVTYWI